MAVNPARDQDKLGCRLQLGLSLFVCLPISHAGPSAYLGLASYWEKNLGLYWSEIAAANAGRAEINRAVGHPSASDSDPGPWT